MIALSKQPSRLLSRCMPLVRNAASKAGGDQPAIEKGRKAVGLWLLGCSGMVFVAVVLGATFYASLVAVVCRVLSAVVEHTGAGK